MSLFLPVRSKGNMAIAICPRCQKKVYYSDLRPDPNNLERYCGNCVDELDPYKLPPRAPETISLQYPRPDTELSDA